MKAAQEKPRIELAFRTLAALVSLFIFYRMGPAVLSDPDTFWHIKVGQNIVETGHFPVVDDMSFTHVGQQWIAKEWLAQIVWYLVNAWGGWKATALAAYAALMLTAWLLHKTLNDSLSPLYATMLTPALMFLSSPTYLARPHLFMLPLAVVWTHRLFKRADEGRPPEFWLLLLLVLWTNVHASYSLAIIIAGFAFLHVLAVTRLKDWGLARMWLAFVVLCPVATLLNPYGVKPLLISMQMATGSNEAMATINEWSPFSVPSHPPLSIAMLMMLGALLTFRPRIALVKIMFALLAVYMFFMYTRFVYVFFLLMPLVVVPDIARHWKILSRQAWLEAKEDAVEKVCNRRIVYVMTAFATAGLTMCYSLWAYDLKPAQPSSAADALQFAVRHKISGNVMNAYDFGGALVYAGIPSYIDGRTDQLFLGKFIGEVVKMQTTDGEAVLKDHINRYNITWTLLTPQDTRNLFLARMPGWHKAYEDSFAVIYLKD